MISLSARTEDLARRLAEHSGRTPEQVVEEAVAAEARAIGIVTAPGDSVRKDVDIEHVQEIIRRVSGRPLRDRRPARDILDEAWGRTG